MGEIDVETVVLETPSCRKTKKAVVTWSVRLSLRTFRSLRRCCLSSLILSAERANMRCDSLNLLVRQLVPPRGHDLALFPIFDGLKNLFVGETRLHLGSVKFEVLNVATPLP